MPTLQMLNGVFWILSKMNDSEFKKEKEKKES